MNDIWKFARSVTRKNSPFLDNPMLPRICMKDGFAMSVQAGEYWYCVPRKSGMTEYKAYEVGYPSAEESLLEPYAEDPDKLTETVYLFVPTEIIDEIMEKHGGFDHFQ